MIEVVVVEASNASGGGKTDETVAPVTVDRVRAVS